ncbi:hypothetical protein BGZ65_011457, partial [Modicella reniformis]
EKHSQSTLEIEDYEGMLVDDFTTSTIERWLIGFDSVQEYRHIILLMDQVTWNILRPFWLRPKNITIVKVPLALDPSMPMTVGVLKEFKYNYYSLLLGDYRKREAQEQEPSLEDRLRLIPKAWCEVQAHTIQRCFKSFLESIRKRPQRLCEFIPFGRLDYIAEKLSPLSTFCFDELKDNDGHESRLSQAVKDAYPGAQNTVLQYYLNQDNDTGPSGLLRAKIREMQHHQDFMDCFGSLVFNQVRIHQQKPQERPEIIAY